MIYTVYNYKTGEYDSKTGEITDWTEYIPQDIACQGLYTCYLRLGFDATHSAVKVLEALASNIK